MGPGACYRVKYGWPLDSCTIDKLTQSSINSLIKRRSFCPREQTVRDKVRSDTCEKMSVTTGISSMKTPPLTLSRPRRLDRGTFDLA